jgi:chromosome segregation ATPase
MQWYEKLRRLGDKIQIISEILESGQENISVDGKTFEERTNGKKFFAKLRDKMKIAKFILNKPNEKINLKGFNYKPLTINYNDSIDYHTKKELLEEPKVLEQKNEQQEVNEEVKQEGKEQQKEKTGAEKAFDEVVEQKMDAYEKRKKTFEDNLKFYNDNKDKMKGKEKEELDHWFLNEEKGLNELKKDALGFIDAANKKSNVINFMKEYDKRKKEMQEEMQHHKEYKSRYNKGDEQYKKHEEKEQNMKKELGKLNEKRSKMVQNIIKTEYSNDNYWAQLLETKDKSKEKESEFVKMYIQEQEKNGVNKVEAVKKLKEAKDKIKEMDKTMESFKKVTNQIRKDRGMELA